MAARLPRHRLYPPRRTHRRPETAPRGQDPRPDPGRLAKYGNQRLAIDSVRGSQIITPVDKDAFATQTTSYTRGLLTPLIINNLIGSDSTRAATVHNPLRTLVAGGKHESLLIPEEGRDGKQAQSIHDAMRTQTTRNETGILTAPRDHMLMEYYGSGQMHPTSKAIPTITTHDRFAMITTLRGTNAPKDVGQPLDTFAANGMHHGPTEWQVPDIDDCEFRMLEPHEVKAGHGLPEGVHHARQQTRTGQDGWQRRHTPGRTRPRSLHGGNPRVS